MKKKNIRNTKGRIVSTAWKLFYEQGYEDTTVDDIIYESETSQGFILPLFQRKGCSALLALLSLVDKYEELSDPTRLVWVYRAAALPQPRAVRMIEDTVSIELLARLLSSQLITKSEKHLLDHDRTYYKLLRSIILAGSRAAELRDDVSG